MSIESGFLTVDATANYLSLPISSIKSMIKKGIIPHYKPFGKRIFCAVADLQDILNKGKVISKD